MNMWTDTFYVSCRSCGYRHDANMVKFVNIEEDIEGVDVMTFTCPNTGETASSWIWRDNSGAVYPEFM